MLDAMTGVVAFTPNDVWAVGYYYHIPLYLSQPLIMHYDGTHWMTIDLPDYPEGSVRLEGLAGSVRDDIYAAGTYATLNGTPRPFMLHYDGEIWTEVVLPPTGGSSEWFQGLVATSDGTVWVVGQYFDGTSTEPMAFRSSGSATTVEERRSGARSIVLAAAPNPFRSVTTVQFSMRRRGPVELSVWDAAGRLVQTLIREDLPEGSHAFAWDGLDSTGRAAAAGVYFVRIRTGGVRAGRSVVLVR